MDLSFAFYMQFLIILHAVAVNCFNFCSSIEEEEEVCGIDKRHIVCYPDSVPMSGTFVATAPMTYKLMRTILKTLNTYRDKVASGSEGNFPKAAEMRQIIWNVELEYIAMHHANRCSTSDDGCHKSRNFPNTAVIRGVYGAAERVGFQDTFDSIFSKIYEQASKITDPDAFTKAYTAEHQSSAADFSLILSDQVSKVGCAIAYCTSCADSSGTTQEHCFFLTCVFDSMNVEDCGVYTATDNSAAKSCGTYGGKKSNEYSSLCTNNGKVYPHRCLAPVSPPSQPPETEYPGSTPPGSTPQGSTPPGSKPPESKPSPRPPPIKPGSPPPSRPPPPSGTIPPIEDDKYNLCPYEKELCAIRKGSKHYVCHPDILKMFGGLDSVHRFNQEEKDFIVQYHNERRDDVASGKVGSKKAPDIFFQKAARMREIVWDDELEHLAEKHARRCHFDHDKCRHTKIYRLSGQNLGFLGSRKGGNKILTVMDKTMFAWYDEHNFVVDPIKRTNTYEEDVIKAEKSGHFIQMMIDEIQRIGCSLTRCTNCTSMEFRPFCFHISCHYDMTGAGGHGVYKPGPPTSKCNEYNIMKSLRYDNLCATGSIIDYTLWSNTGVRPVKTVVPKID